MGFRIIFLEPWGKALVPKKFRPDLRSYLLKAGFNEVPYKLFGLMFYVSLATTLLIYFLFIYPYVRKLFLFEVSIYPVIGFTAAFLGWAIVESFFAILFTALVYFYLDLRIYSRTRKIEEQLADYLQVVSSNLKGGMTFERALWAAIKPRFGVLGKEMSVVSKKVMTGYELSKALTELTEKYGSSMLKRTVDLVISEAESGGNIAALIDRIVDNLKEAKELKAEMSAAAIAYIIFISMIILVIAPLLFAFALHLLSTVTTFINRVFVTVQRVPGLPFVFTKTEVAPADFKIFSMTAIVVLSLFSSMIVSIVEKGDIKGGLKYIPIYVFGSLASYFLFVKILTVLFGRLLPA